jgi:hypothetical protein
MATYHFHQMVAIFGWSLSYRLAFEVVIEVFIGIQFWAISWQKEHLNLLAMTINPRADCLSLMNWVLVEDQKDFSTFTMLDEAPEESDEYASLESTLEYLECRPP